jgi:mannitol-1-/sugar-/sorbitol-6-/2-deoxyglucose-6-phosphatase
MIKAIIFDMDGLLIDSEILWRKVETSVFSDLGLPLEKIDFNENKGFKINETVQYWYNKFPWSGKDLLTVQQEIIDKVEQSIKQEAVKKEGVDEIIKFFQEKGIPMSIASSSPYKIIDTALNKFDIKKHIVAIRSGQDEEYGKPHPAIFISMAKELQVDPTNCLVFEDSFSGVIAAKAAKMKCVAVPVGEDLKKFQSADLVLSSLKQFNDELFSNLK